MITRRECLFLAVLLSSGLPAAAQAPPSDEIIRVFPTTTPQPDPSSNEFVQVVDTVTTGTSPTRTVVVNGIDLVFDSSITNGLWKSYNGLTGITNMVINARSVTFKSATTLPGTNVSITAQTLQFKGPGALITTPSAALTPPSQIGANGMPGQNGGSLTLQISTFLPDAANPIPIDLSGGPGGAPGPGAQGAAGQSLNVQTPFGAPSQGQNSDNIPDGSVVCIDYKSTNVKKENPIHLQYFGSCTSLPAYPTNGGDATPAGIPGVGGASGNLSSTIDIGSSVRQAGGSSAVSLGTYAGGQAGTPTVSTWAEVDFNADGGPYWHLWPGTGIVTTTQGKDAISPSASAPTGPSGAFTAQSATGWATATYIAQRLEYATALYKTNYFQLAATELSGIVSDLTNSLSSQESNNDVLAQLNQASQLLARLSANLNYFSMPQNFAPLTTLELNAQAYSNEIKDDISVLYLQAVVTSATKSLQDKLSAIQTQSQNLQTDITKQSATISTALASLNSLNAESTQDQQALSQYTASAQAIDTEQQIEAQAELQNAALQQKSSVFSTLTKIALGVAQLVPALAPVTPIINAVAAVETAATGNAPWTTLTAVNTLAQNVVTATADCTQLPLTIVTSTTTLPNAVTNKPYSATLAAQGGKQPYVWTPMNPLAGLTLSPSGTLSGLLTTAGTSDAFTVKVEDSSSPQQTTTATLKLTTKDPPSGDGGGGSGGSGSGGGGGGGGGSANTSTSLSCILPALTPKNISTPQGIETAITDVTSAAAAVGTIVNGIAQTESNTSISSGALATELNKVKQQDPILNQLGTANSSLTTDNMNLRAKIDQTNQTITTAANQIVSDLLAINTFNSQLSSNVQGLSPETVERVNQLATDAEHRLEWYQQLLLASQQYVQLTPSTVALDVSQLRQNIVALVAAGGPAVPLDATISAEVTLFEQDLATVTQSIISYYSGHYPPIRASFAIKLTAEQIQALNSGQDVTFNPIAAGIVPQGATDVRVAAIQVPTLDIVPPAGSRTVANLQLNATFPGTGRISSGGKLYEFFFYPSNNPSPVVFGASKDLISGTLSQNIPSPAAVSLLTTIVGAGNNTTPFTTLPADSPYVLHAYSNTDNNTPLAIQNATLQVFLDYVPAQPSVVDVQIASPQNLSTVSFQATTDSFQRAAGNSAPAVRRYTSGTTVTITAPQQVGQLTIKGYDDGRGNILTTNAQFTASVTSSVTVRPLYSFPGLFITCTPNAGPQTVALPFSTTCSATGGTEPYTWSIASGSLPAGLALQQVDGSSATVSGIPGTAGAYTFAVRATDSASNSGLQSFTGTLSGTGPAISGFSPSSATAGGSTFTLTVNGQGFNSGAVARWNGNGLATTYVSATQLTATVTSTLVAAPGLASVDVVNLNGTTSQPASFAISAATPAISSLSPASATAGGTAFTLTVNGTNYVSGCTAQWGSTTLTTTFVSATQLTASVTGQEIAAVGNVSVTVACPGPVTSSATMFAVLAPTNAASPIVYYDIGIATSSSLPLPPVYVGGSNAGITASSFSSAGLHPAWACCQSLTGELSFSGWGSGGSGGPGPANGPNANAAPYLQFSVTANGASVRLSQLNYSWFSTLNSDLYNGADRLSVYVSFDNFATNTQVSSHGVQTRFPTPANVQNYSDDLSALTINPGQTMTVRFISWSDAAYWDAGSGPWNAGTGNGNISLVGAITPQLMSQSITFGNLSSQAMFTVPAALSATASSGLTVTFTSNTAAVCTVSGTALTLISTGSCSLTANQAGNGIYAPAAPITQSFTVTPAGQTITFAPLSNAVLGSGTVTLTATASSGLAVSVVSTIPSVCTVNNSTVTLVAVGSCAITASQTGNANYAAATPVTQTFSVLAPANLVTLAVGTGSGASGRTVELPITLAESGTAAPTGFQMDLGFDANKLNFISARAGEQSTVADKGLFSSTLPNGLIRLLVAGVNQTTIAGGAAAYASFQLTDGFTSGSSTITAANCASTDSSGGGIPTSCAAGLVKYADCDINADGSTNVSDVQLIINEALSVVPSTHDLNGDGVVNVSDVQIVINAVLELGCNAH